MKKGDIALIPFPFTDLSGSKIRPALVLIEKNLDVTVTFISTKTKWKEETDILLSPSKENGLKKESLIRLSKIATIDKELVYGILGNIKIHELNLIDKNLLKLFKINQ